MSLEEQHLKGTDVTIRTMVTADIPEVVALAQDGFGKDIAFEPDHYETQISKFPDGQICALYDGKIIGSSSSLIVNFDANYVALNHTFKEISDDGYIRNHDTNGMNLYGIEVVVYPDYRHMKVGRRLYEARKKVCKALDLKSIIIGGRIPNYHKYAATLSAEAFVEKVMQEELYDPVLSFQKKNGFELRGVIANYLPEDNESMKYATLMEWINPQYRAPGVKATRTAMRR